jgi:S1-C subfamily serine protease
MTRILILLASLLVVGESFALPPCPTGIFHNCYGTFTWANGNKYVGEFKDGELNGQGTKTWANGNKYVGEFKDGKSHGQGTYTSPNGDKYVGEWKDGKRRGQGTYTWASGDKYVGEHKDGKPHGQGTYTSANGDKYVGENREGPWDGIRYFASGKVQGTYSNGKWCGGCKPTARQLAIVDEINSGQIAAILPPCPTGVFHNCYGTHTWVDGDKYTGEFKDGWPHGQGTYTWTSGGKYTGEYKNGNMHGQGTYTYANGNKYVGEWRDGMEHGQGTFTWVDGKKYVGEFKDGKRRGQGTYTWPDGTKYVGEWKYDKPHGQGTYTFADGDKYVGKHKDGKRNGQGTYILANGNKYVGEYKDGKQSEGIRFLASGKIWGTVSGGKPCAGCKPTARQLAIVREIESGEMAKAPQKPTLTVKSNPTNANVSIDGSYKGKTELKIQLTPDHYHVWVSKNGYNDFIRVIKLARGKDIVLSSSLSKTKESIPKTIEYKPKPKPESGRKLIGTGTGFVVNKYYVVTAEHVLEDCNAVSIRHRNRKIGAQTVARDASNDLGLIRLQKPIGNTAKLRGGKRVRLGERVANYGYPLFGQLSTSATITEGNVNNLSGWGDDPTLLQFDAPTQPGNSGGPLLDRSGNVIGVAIKGLSKKYADATGHIAQNVNFAVKSNIVVGFLQSNNIPFQTAASTEKLELPDIAEKAEAFTVFVGCWE